MRTKTIELFNYEELSPEAQAKARDWYREASAGDSYWHESAIEDFCETARMLGFTLDRARGTRTIPAVYFSGFWSQGDGASFAGSWLASDCKAAQLIADRPATWTDDAGKVHKNAGNAELCRIAHEFGHLAKEWPGASGAITVNGWYSHSGTMRADFYLADDGDAAEVEETFLQASRDLADWLYRVLEIEYEYMQSDEVVAETIVANGYEFTEDGEIA